MADNDTSEQLEANPLDMDAAADTAMSTVTDIWAAFVGHTPYLIGSLLVLVLTWLIAYGVDNFGHRLLANWKKRDSFKELILRLLGILVWALGLMLAGIVLFPGLTPARAIGSLGLVSIAVSLAFKDIFENFFAGILLLLRFPFERGDFIECDGIKGRVEKVLMRMSYIRMTTGELVVVPNAVLFKNPVRILTAKPLRRITVMTGVAYDEDADAAIELIESTLCDCDTVNSEEPIQVFANAFGSSSIDIEMTWWTEPTPLDERRSRHEVITRVKRALDDAGIEIPFPYRTLTFSEPLAIVDKREN